MVFMVGVLPVIGRCMGVRVSDDRRVPDVTATRVILVGRSISSGHLRQQLGSARK
jgi:hypothetical protein